MYVKNAAEFLLQMNFIEDKTNHGDEARGFYKQINENLQLFAVSTSENDIMFISEHKILNPHLKFFEDDYNNIEILSEYVNIDEFTETLLKYELISELYFDLLKIINRLQIRQMKIKDEDVRDNLQNYIDWAEECILHMNDKNVEDGIEYVWCSEEEIVEFIEHCKKDGVI